MEVCGGHIVTGSIVMTIDGDSRLSFCMRLYQHLTVLGQHILALVHYPVFIIVFRLGSGNIGLISLFISIIVALPIAIVAVTVLDADKELTVLFVGAIYITDITATEDVTILACQFLRSSHCTSEDVYLRLSEDITIGVERTAFTQVVVASTTTKDVTVYVAFEKFDCSLTGFIDTLQHAYAVVLTAGVDHTTANSCNLTSTEEGITDVPAIHLHIGDIHTTVVDIAATEDTTTIIQAVRTIACPRLVIQFLLVVVRTHLDIIAVARRHSIETTIANKALVKCDVGRTEYGTALTTTVGITLDSRNTVDETGTVELTDGDMCLTEDVISRTLADGTFMIAHTASPAATIDVTGCTALNIGIGCSPNQQYLQHRGLSSPYRQAGRCR